MLVGGLGEKLRQAPRVEARGSSVYRVGWKPEDGATCGAELQVRLEYRRSNAHEWHVLTDRSELSSIEPKLRCEEGCSFRTQVQNIAGWAVESMPSPLLATLPLHPLIRGAARLEVQLLPTDESKVPIQRRQFEEHVAAALSLDVSRISCIEILELTAEPPAPSPIMIVFDLLPKSQDDLFSVSGVSETARSGSPGKRRPKKRKKSKKEGGRGGGGSTV